MTEAPPTHQVIIPLPFITDSQIDARLHKYASDVNDHRMVEYHTKQIAEQIVDQAEHIAREIALFKTVFITYEPLTEKLQVHKPSTFAWAN